MSYYINSGLMRQALMAPKRKPFTKEMLALDTQAEALEVEMDSVEISTNPVGMKSRKPAKWWKLNTERAVIDMQLTELDRHLNKQWYEYWDV